MKIFYGDYKDKNMLYNAIEDTYNKEDKTIEVELKELYIANTALGKTHFVRDQEGIHIILKDTFSYAMRRMVIFNEFKETFPNAYKKLLSQGKNERTALKELRFMVEILEESLNTEIENLIQAKAVKCNSIEEFVK